MEFQKHIRRSYLWKNSTWSIQWGKQISDEEEEELVAFILGCSSIGYSKTIKEMLVVVQSTLELRGVHKVISYGWCMHGSHFVRGIQILHCMLQHLCPCHHYIFLHLFFIYLFLHFLVLISATARTIEEYSFKCTSNHNPRT